MAAIETEISILVSSKNGVPDTIFRPRAKKLESESRKGAPGGNCAVIMVSQNNDSLNIFFSDTR